MNNIEEICEKYNIRNYTINEDGSIDVDGDVNLYSRGLTELPLKFNKVTSDFNCSDNKLKSLKGSPKIVFGTFRCTGCGLTSLEYSPEYIGVDFLCGYNNIKDLYGISDNIGYYFHCHHNPIESIFERVNIDFIRAFNGYRVIKDDKVVLKRLKYVMETFDMDYDLDKIKKEYEII